jgi:hypothetical protein
MSSLVHQGALVRREAEAMRGAGVGVKDRVWRMRGCRGRACRKLKCQCRAWRVGNLRSTYNRRGVGWSNRANRRRRTGREEGVQVVGRCVGGGNGEG